MSGFAELPAGYLLWCRCTAELYVLNDDYTRQWHLQLMRKLGSGSERVKQSSQRLLL